MAQSPGFFSYQAVATDMDGNELVNQKISLRITVLKDGPNGIPQYAEVHASPNLKTDDFGLFTVELGAGALQPGSPFQRLEDIDWSTGNFWLRVEMDATGGFNFNFIGVNRLLSVPYALYSQRAKLADKALVADKAKFADTALVALTIKSNSAAKSDTAKYAFNAGLAQNAVNAQNAVQAQTATNAQHAVNAQNATNAQHAVQAQTANHANTASQANSANFAAKSDTAKYAFNAGLAQNAVNAQNAATAQNAVQAQNATNAQNAINAQNAATAQNAVQAQTAAFATTAATALDDMDKNPTNELQDLKYDTATNLLSLVPKGQGGSVSLDLTQVITNTFTTQNFIINPSFPEGLRGKYVVIPNNYVVPANKSLYLTAAGPQVYLPVYGELHPTAPSMPVFPEYTVIQNCRCTAILVDRIDSIQVTLINLNTLPGNTYTVPPGKVFFVKSGLAIDRGFIDVKAPGTNDFLLYELSNSPNEAATRVITFPEGTQIRKPAFINSMILTGYLGKTN